MPPVSRLTDLTTTGHLCTPTAPMGMTTNVTVFAQFLPIVRPMDQTVFHPIEVSLNPLVCLPHVGVVMMGVMNVFTSMLPTATIGKPCDFGALIQGAMTVWAGGFDTGTVSSVAGGTPPGGQLSDVGAGSKYA